MLLAFVDNDRLALEVAKEAERKDFKDFYTPLILASLMYFKGDSVKEFYEILNRVRLLARERQDVIKRVIDACARPCVTQELASRLRVRARRMELTAMNNIAYAVAADVAEGRKEAEALLPIAVEYADDLREADKKDPEASDDTFLDTAAFVTIVAEAHRARSKMTNLNKKKIEEAITLLEKLDAKRDPVLSHAFR